MPEDLPHTDGKPRKASMSDTAAAIYNRLRRLQEHSRSNMTSMLAHRSMSSFTLHHEPIPPEAARRVELIVFPQDPFAGDPEIRWMDGGDIQPGLVNSRFRMADSRTSAAEPDEDGNYLCWPGTSEFNQVNAFYYATMTLRMYERYANRHIPWSFPSPRLAIDTHAGSGGNAFYNEQDRLLGFDTVEFGGEQSSTALSADIVSHETGHAVLDGIRDLYNESFGLGPSAFHESFGDMTAMLIALHDDSLLRRMLEYTGGDLRLENFVTQMAEYVTQLLQDQQIETLHSHGIYLRNAINDLRYQSFDSLHYYPPQPETTLGLQAHNYSRLFTGAFYDILVGIFELLNDDMPAHIALHRARDIAGSLLTLALELGPVGEFDFFDMACALIAADTMRYDSRFSRIISRSFAEERSIGSIARFNDYKAMLDNLPEVYLPETLNSALASALFLEEKVLPALDLNPNGELIPLAAYRNASGFAFLTYFSARTLTLEGPEFRQFNGAQIEMFGGLTLGCGADNRLRSVCYRPVSDEDVRQVKVMVAQLITDGLIAENGGQAPTYFRSKVPRAVLVPESPPLSTSDSDGQTTPAKRKLVRHPTLTDDMPPRVSHILDYLKLWKRKTE
jgi:hypothetical protein